MKSGWRQWLLFQIVVPLGALVAALLQKLQRGKQPLLWADLTNLAVPQPRPSSNVTGVYTVAMMTSSVSPEEVELPKGVEFAPESAGRDGRYFAVLGFGYQQAVRPAWAPTWLGAHYLEIICGVAGVRVQNQPELGNFAAMARLLVDNQFALWLGRLFGMPKIMAADVSSVKSYWYVDSNIKAQVDGKGSLEVDSRLVLGPSISTGDPKFAVYRQFLNLPVLSRNFLGKLLAIDFGFQFDQARLEPVSVNADAQLPGFPGLPVGKWSWPGLNTAPPYAACRISVPWIMRPATGPGADTGGVPRPGPFPAPGFTPFPSIPPEGRAEAASASDGPNGKKKS